MSLSRSGYNYRSFGNIQKGMEYCLKAVDMAQETGDMHLIVFSKMNLSYIYQTLGDYPKAIELLEFVAKNAEKIKYPKVQTWAYGNLAVIYLDKNEPKKALEYGQKCYELCLKIDYYDYFGYRLINLADAHAKLGNTALAISFYDMGIKDALKTKSSKQLNFAYTAKALYYRSIHQQDSSLAYAKKAIDAVRKTAFSNYGLKSAKLLLEIYKPINSDSALKYSEVYRIANDSLYNLKTVQQAQLMTFENEIKQQKLAEEKAKIEEERNENIQYSLIAFGIISFIILFLLFSRTVVANEKLISFFGVISLLIVFEFLNLLLHPFLEKITHHSPILMLLALVCIAALLVPLHHKAEHWATRKLVEKNKEIRLANAKKTIEQLEEKS